MAKRILMIDDQKINGDDIGAVETTYDAHTMTLIIDLVGASALNHQDAMVVAKMTCDYDEKDDDEGMEQQLMVRDYLHHCASLLTAKIGKYLVMESFGVETVDFRPVFEKMQKLSAEVPHLDLHSYLDFIHDKMSEEGFHEICKHEREGKGKFEEIKDYRAVNLDDCTICLNYIDHYRVTLDDHFIVLTFLGKDGHFFIKKSYELSSDASKDVLEYAREAVSYYLNTFRIHPELYNTVLMLDDFMGTVDSFVLDYCDDYDEFKENIDEELNYYEEYTSPSGCLDYENS